MNIVMTANQEYIEVQGTAENEPLSQDVLNQLLSLSQKGIQEIIKKQSEFI